ncbi:MAG: hypothetical protein DMG02_28550 [Acidobacteria bacterium]|nr:MAG: hypothetical protein DMG02_28550 [Acidobacteriota bacterium]
MERMTELHETAAPWCDACGVSHLKCAVSPIAVGNSITCRTRSAMSDSANEAVVRRAIEAIWNRGDLDVADDLFAADYVNHAGVITDLLLGPEAIRISAALHRLAFPDLCVVVEELSTDEDTVVLRWTARRGSAARTDGSAVLSNQKSLTGITRSRLAGGKIIESWTEWDRIGVLRELGLVPTE